MDAKDGKQRKHQQPRREVQRDRIELAMSRTARRERVKQRLQDELTLRLDDKERDEA